MSRYSEFIRSELRIQYQGSLDARENGPDASMMKRLFPDDQPANATPDPAVEAFIHARHDAILSIIAHYRAHEGFEDSSESECDEFLQGLLSTDGLMIPRALREIVIDDENFRVRLSVRTVASVTLVRIQRPFAESSNNQVDFSEDPERGGRLLGLATLAGCISAMQEFKIQIEEQDRCEEYQRRLRNLIDTSAGYITADDVQQTADSICQDLKEMEKIPNEQSTDWHSDAIPTIVLQTLWISLTGGRSERVRDHGVLSLLNELSALGITEVSVTNYMEGMGWPTNRPVTLATLVRFYEVLLGYTLPTMSTTTLGGLQGIIRVAANSIGQNNNVVEEPERRFLRPALADRVIRRDRFDPMISAIQSLLGGTRRDIRAMVHGVHDRRIEQIESVNPLRWPESRS